MSLSRFSSFDHEHRVIFFQAARYAVAGFIITLLFSASYWAVTDLLHIDPNVSLTLVFLVFTAVSYFTHGAFSFRGHGERDRQHVRMTRFLVVNLLAFALNQFCVWFLVKHLGGETWWPIIPFLFVTPWLTFALHRKWVYA